MSDSPTASPPSAGLIKGVVLAAGKGRRLGELGSIPKTLLPVRENRTLLDLILDNVREVGIRQVTVVVGFAGDLVTEQAARLEADHDIALGFVRNDRYDWNNAYSAWLASGVMDSDTILVNGDTLHPATVERALIDASRVDEAPLLVAIDTAKILGDEEMKVTVDASGGLRTIHKQIDPALAAGEYIGVSLVRRAFIPRFRDAMERTWRADRDRYYEDGYQVLADDGHRIATVPIGVVDWVEVDTPHDLERARELACRS